jgi:hypothetical protein
VRACGLVPAALDLHASGPKIPCEYAYPGERFAVQSKDQ